MADLKINGLAAAGAVIDNMQFETDIGGTTANKVTGAQLKTYMGTVFVKTDGSTPLTADWDAGAHKITAETLESDVVTGTAPLTVASTTVVTNLNADLLDGQEGAYYAVAQDLTDHETAANPHSGSAASGANTDITSLGDGTTATTQSSGDNSTKLATTEYVDSLPHNELTYKKLTVLSAGQTAFTLSSTPGAPTKSLLDLGGQNRIYGTDYTISGTTLTWLDPVEGGSALTLKTTDILQIWYDIPAGAGSAPVDSVFSRTGAVTAQSGDYTVGQVTGAAASGANSDITSLTGMTTPLSIAQGGTNSGSALTNDRVMVSSAGKVIESSTITTTELGLLNGIVSVSTGTADNDKFVTQGYVDDIAPPSTKSHLIYAEPSANYNNRRVRAIGSTGSFRLNFSVPDDFTGTLTVKVIAYPVSGAGGTGKDIDISGEYTTTAGASATEYTFSDTTSTYDLGTDDTRAEVDITSLFTNLAAGSEGALLWDNKGLGGTLNVVGIKIINS